MSPLACSAALFCSDFKFTHLSRIPTICLCAYGVLVTAKDTLAGERYEYMINWQADDCVELSIAPIDNVIMAGIPSQINCRQSFASHISV